MALGRHTHPLGTAKNEVFLLTARLAGGGAGQTLVAEEPFKFASEIASIARSAEGVFAITFKYPYPQMLALLEPVVVSSTVGLKARWTAYDAAAGTATLRVEREGGSTIAAWSSAAVVAADTLAIATAGMITAVHLTAGGVTGAGHLMSSAPAVTREVQVAYTAGVPTLNFLAADAVTECKYQQISAGAVADPGTSDDIHLSWIVRNRKD